MCCRGALSVALLLIVAPRAWAQVPEAETPYQPGAEAADTEGPETGAQARALAGPEASGESVVGLARFISAYLEDSGRVPGLAQVMTSRGRLRIVSAAEAFVLVARTAQLWRQSGELPEAVRVGPAGVRPPELDPEDIPEGEVDMAVGREVPTEPLLEQCAATVDWVDRLSQVPTAVWVDGERLSAAEYLAALAICLEHAYREGGLLETVFLPAYAPPYSWAALAPRVQAQPSMAGAGETEAAAVEPEEAEFQGEVLPASPTQSGPAGPSPASPESPRLTLFPEPGATLSGRADLVASYIGPPASFVVFTVDGRPRAIMNIPPYSYRWDTSLVPPGMHTVTVEVLGAGGTALAEEVGIYTVAAPTAEEPEEQTPDDL